MLMTTGLVSSASDEWYTPPELFAGLDAEFHFTVDVCATTESAKCERYFTAAQDGLSQSWAGRAWCNPPYGRALPPWVAKACKESVRGAWVVCLVPARTDTAWWHNYVMYADEIRFIRGRLKFAAGDGQQVSSAPFPSAVVVFQPGLVYEDHPRISAIDRTGRPL